MKKRREHIIHELVHEHQWRRLPVLWSPSSFLSTAGNVSSETIARYIQQQSEHEEVPASTPAPEKERPFIPV